MTMPSELPIQKLQFYVTTPYSCGYLENKMAQSLIVTPQFLINSEIYNNLIKQGFRRSGKFVYRPHCENCQACIPVRLPVNSFVPSRSQKRAYKQHQGLTTRILPVEFKNEHFDLYSAYQVARHNGSNELDSKEQYQNFLTQSNVNSRIVEFRLNNLLKIVSVVDLLDDGISAVYTFFETKDTQASYGTFNIMWMANWCQNLGLPFLYLGYWIKNSKKMDYKQKFKPQEMLIDNKWELLTSSPP